MKEFFQMINKVGITRVPFVKLALVFTILSSTSLYAQHTQPKGFKDLEGGFGVDNSIETQAANNQFDYGAGLVDYLTDPTFGPYTHVVDGVNGSDTDNEFGTFASPRKTIPKVLPAGSIVQVVGNAEPFVVGDTITGNGSTLDKNDPLQTNGVYVRGAGDQKVKVTGTDGHIVLNGSYVVFENFEVSGATITVEPSDHIVIRNSSVTQAPHSGIRLWNGGESSGADKKWMVVYNNTIYENGVNSSSDSSGVSVGNGAKNVFVMDNEIYGNMGDGVTVLNRLDNDGELVLGNAPDRVHIGRNIIHDDSLAGINAGGGTKIVISENEVYNYEKDNTQEGIRLTSQSNENYVIFNYIHHIGRGFAPNGSTEGNYPYLIGNIITNADRATMGDVGAAIHNVVYDVKDGIRKTYGPVINNIMVNCTGIPMTGNSLYMANNLYFNNAAEFECNDCITQDPLFTDAAGGDFTLMAGSPAIDAGTGTDVYLNFFNSFGVDILVDRNGGARAQGNNWDIGAYESGEGTAATLNTVTIDMETVGSEVAGGAINPLPGVHQYITGSPATLLVTTVESGFQFDGWSGDMTSEEDTIEFTVSADVSIKGTFGAEDPVVEDTLQVFGVEASGFEDDGEFYNPPEHSYDGDLGTRWTSFGLGEWIKYDLGHVGTLEYVKIGWHDGANRGYKFDLELSLDGSAWTKVIDMAETSGTTSEQEVWDFEDQEAKFVRITCYGYNQGASEWTNISEIDFYGQNQSEGVLLSAEDEIKSNGVQIFPNPFVSDLTLKYHLSSPSDVKVSLLDLKGQEISELFNGRQPSGNVIHSWNILKEAGVLRKGLYFIRVSNAEFQNSFKVILGE